MAAFSSRSAAAFALGQGHPWPALLVANAVHDRSWRLGRTLVDAVLKLRNDNRELDRDSPRSPRSPGCPNCETSNPVGSPRRGFCFGPLPPRFWGFVPAEYGAGSGARQLVCRAPRRSPVLLLLVPRPQKAICVNRPTGRTLSRGKRGDQVRCPNRQEHENDWRIEDWRGLKSEKSRAHAVPIRHCDEGDQRSSQRDMFDRG
jgi:hypothetical protein